MKLQIQKGAHCLLYAAATILDVAPDLLRSEIGYSGNEVWWPEAKFPANLRSFHIQEINECFMSRGMALSLRERYPRYAPDGLEHQWKLINDREVLDEKLNACLQQVRTAILIGVKPSGTRHALVWHDNLIYDPTPPNGNICELEKLPYDFGIIEVWFVCNLITK